MGYVGDIEIEMTYLQGTYLGQYTTCSWHMQGAIPKITCFIAVACLQGTLPPPKGDATCWQKETRRQEKTSSSQPWWQRPILIVFDLGSLSWGFGSTIVHGITSEPQNILSNVLYWHVCRPGTVWLQFQRGISNRQVWGLGDVGIGGRPIRKPAHGFLLAPHWHPPPHPPVGPEYDDNYRSISYSFVERQK